MDILNLTVEEINSLEVGEATRYLPANFAERFPKLSKKLAEKPGHVVRFIQFCWMLDLTAESVAVALSQFLRPERKNLSSHSVPDEFYSNYICGPCYPFTVDPTEAQAIAKHKVFDALANLAFMDEVSLYVRTHILECEAIWTKEKDRWGQSPRFVFSWPSQG